jgi:RNA polymerase sigma factor (sigma-70 family)
LAAVLSGGHDEAKEGDMAIAELFPVLHYLHKLAAERHPETVTDAELLAQFRARGDDAAFTALVQRHGRMVWNVCRRLLRDWQAAEDAFQATFMVLARKAAAIRTPEQLSCWLYGVAYRTALKARTDRARRPCEQPLADQAAKPAPDWEDVRPVLDAEIGCLPAFCREAFILCYLEGKTNDQAARLLGWPKGTVATRLARARERLRLRLVRHGVTLSAAALSAMLAPDSLASALPPGLVAPTTKTALRFAAGQAVLGLSTRAVTLAQGVIKTMFVSKLKLMAALTLAVAVVVSGTGTMLLSGAPSAADASGETAAADKTELQYELVMTAPPPSTAEQALFFSASTNFLLGHYGEAKRECARFVQSYAESALADSAIQLGLIATQLADRGEHDASQTAKAKAIINAALKSEPLAAQIKQPTVAGQLADTELAQAEKDFRVAEFYRRTNHLGAAFFYYEIVRRRYPGTEYAAKASRQLETLRETTPQEKLPTEADSESIEAKQKQITELMEQCKKLLREGKYDDAVLFATKAYELDSNNPALGAALYTAELLRSQKQAGSAPERKEREIERRLSMPVNLEFKGTPFKEAMDELCHITGINIIIDQWGFDEAGIRLEKPLTMKLEGVSLKSALNTLLHQVGACYVLKGEVLQITPERRVRPTESSQPSSKPRLSKRATIGGFPVEGCDVQFDEKQNRAWVSGAGAIRITAGVGIQGERLAKPDILTIHWKRDMVFDGCRVTFHGGVQAEQGNTRLACQELQLLLDRDVPVDPDRSWPPVAGIERIICDKSVRLQTAERTDGKQSRYQRIESSELSCNHEEGVTVAPGPGVLRVLQSNGAAVSVQVQETQTGSLMFGLGANSDAGLSGSVALNEANPGILTRVNYRGRMLANSTTRTAIFYDGVELVHVPSNDPDLAIDIDKLPERALYLRCDQLKFYNRREANSKEETQQLEAHGHALVIAREFSGRADLVRYDESKDLLVLEASAGNLATLVRQRANGTAQEEVKGKKIYYWRRTNDLKVEGSTGAKPVP